MPTSLQRILEQDDVLPKLLQNAMSLLYGWLSEDTEIVSTKFAAVALGPKKGSSIQEVIRSYYIIANIWSKFQFLLKVYAVKYSLWSLVQLFFLLQTGIN